LLREEIVVTNQPRKTRILGVGDILILASIALALVLVGTLVAA
jgi:hypothetical protein